MAQKKGGGSTRNGRDSQPKMLGVKVFGGQMIPAGSIIVRQRAPSFMQARTSASARTTRFSPWSMARSATLSRAHGTARRCSSRLPDRACCASSRGRAQSPGLPGLCLFRPADHSPLETGAHQ